MAWPCFEEAEEAVTLSCDKQKQPRTTHWGQSFGPQPLTLWTSGARQPAALHSCGRTKPSSVLPSNRGMELRDPRSASQHQGTERAPGHPQDF